MTANNTPSGVVIWIEDFTRDLAAKASSEVLEKHFEGLAEKDLQLRLLYLAQMVASNTLAGQRRHWGMKLIRDLARHDGVDLG